MRVKELVHFCKKLPDTNSSFARNMRLKVARYGYLKLRKKLPRELAPFHQPYNSLRKLNTFDIFLGKNENSTSILAILAKFDVDFWKNRFFQKLTSNFAKITKIDVELSFFPKKMSKVFSLHSEF